MKNCECSTECRHEGEAAVLETGCACGCPGESERDNEEGEIKSTILWLAGAVALAAAGFLLPQAKTALLAASVLAAGWPVFWQGIKNILKLDLEELSLLTIAVVAAAAIGELPEAVMVTILFRVGELLEDLAVSRSRREIEAATKIIPENANLLLQDGSTKSISAKQINIGDKMLIKNGERVPVDCSVISGGSTLDCSSLTGESAPRDAGPGDRLLSGMVNLGGVLTCEATSTFDNSTASRIVEMVRESAAKKGGTERLISRFARVYTPIVIGLALAVALLPPLLGFGEFRLWVGRALVFLVASCPCALVIATPLAFFAGIGACSKRGILVKGSKYIEALAKTSAVVFDKTGTLTTGALSVESITGEPETLELAAILESYSNHPIAKAIVAAYGSPDAAKADNCEEIASYGLRAAVDGAEVLCGSRRLMEQYNVDTSHLPEANVYVAKDGGALGCIAVADTPRQDAAETIERLRAMGIGKTVMLTGDAEAAAQKTAEKIGINKVFANLLPQNKVERLAEVRALQAGSTLFVGDGINDSPVLAASDAGVAMGMGSDAAIEAADVVLLSDKLAALPQAISIARKTASLARFNIAFALAVKAAVLILAFFGAAGMWLAVFADVGVAILSVLNATRALRFRE